MDYLFLDPGSSGTKVLAYDGFCHSYFVEPGVQEIGALTEERRDEERWIDYEFGAGVLQIGEKSYRLGHRPPVCCSAMNKGPHLILKALAALSSKDCGRGKSYVVGLMLPFDEFAYKDKVKEELQRLLPKAKFNGKPIKAKLETIKVHPEGSGLILQPRGNQLALMAGHTDLSKIWFSSGRVNSNKSKTYSGMGVGAIAQTLGIAGSDVSLAKALSKGRFKELAAQNGLEESYIKRVESIHRSEFIHSEIKPRFEAYPWLGLDEVVIAGGGADYLRQDLRKLIPIKVKRSPSIKGLRLFGTSDQRYRDIYGMAYRELKQVIEAKLSGDEVQKVDVEVV